MEPVKILFSRRAWRAVRLLLVVLLPLHAGLAQAAMVRAPHAPDFMAQSIAGAHSMAEAHPMPAADSMADAMPCHDASPPVSDPSPHHEGGCCDTGACHCAVAAALPMLLPTITPQPGSRAAPFPFLAVPAAALPPDLRPPIA